MSGPSEHNAYPRDIDADVRLVKRIRAGSIKAWHEFLEQYSGLVYGVIKRHLFTDDEDTRRTMYVDVLDGLYNGGIAKYEGRAPLSTWIIVFTRARTFDAIRREKGRFRLPKAYDALSNLDREVLRLFYVERASLEFVIHVLRWKGFEATADDVIGSIEHIESTVDRRYLDRLDREHQARLNGLGSAKALQQLVRVRHEYEEQVQGHNADRATMEREADDTAANVRDMVEKLPAEDREVLHMRFGLGWTANRISDEMKLGSQRRAYALIERALNRLRKHLQDAGAPGIPAPAPNKRK